MARSVKVLQNMTKTALIVDDEPDLAEGCALLLQRAGFDFHLAFSVEQAIRVLGSLRPAVVLSDINFPGRQDGFDLATHVRKRYPQMPVILMTGYHSPAIEAQVRDAGAAFLRKPFTADELIFAVQAALP